MKLSRRDFLKYASLLGAISPAFNVDLIRDNLDKFTVEQLEELGKVEKIEKGPVAPYHMFSDRYYAVHLKDDNTVYMWRKEIIKHYGSVDDFLDNVNVDRLDIASPPANWND